MRESDDRGRVAQGPDDGRAMTAWRPRIGRSATLALAAIALAALALASCSSPSSLPSLPSLSEKPTNGDVGLTWHSTGLPVSLEHYMNDRQACLATARRQHPAELSAPPDPAFAAAFNRCFMAAGYEPDVATGLIKVDRLLKPGGLFAP